MQHLHSVAVDTLTIEEKRLLAFCQFPCIKFALNTLTLRGHLHLNAIAIAMAIASLELRWPGIGWDWTAWAWAGMGWDAMR